MTTYIFDIAIVLALIFFAWRGGKKGLILTVFSLLSIFVAFFGARFVSTQFAKPVANIIRPSIQLTIEEVLTGQTPDGAPASTPAVLPIPGQQADGEEETAPPAADFTLQQILDLLDESELFSGLRDYLEDAIEDKTLEITTTAAAAVSSYLSQLMAAALLFGLSFVGILLVWFLASRAMDIAFKLPILSAVNTGGGAALGLVKGVLVLLVLVWLARLAGLVSDANAGPVVRMMTVPRLSELLHTLMAAVMEK